MTADYPLLDATGGGGLKLTPTGLDRSRYRHEPYSRYSTKVVTWRKKNYEEEEEEEEILFFLVYTVPFVSFSVFFLFNLCVCVCVYEAIDVCVRACNKREDWLDTVSHPPCLLVRTRFSFLLTQFPLSLSVSTARRRKKTSRICCASNWRFFSFAFSCRRLMTHSTAPWAGLPVLSYSLPIFLLLFSIWSSIGCERACFLSLFLFCASFSMPLCCIPPSFTLVDFRLFLVFPDPLMRCPPCIFCLLWSYFPFFSFYGFQTKKKPKKKELMLAKQLQKEIKTHTKKYTRTYRFPNPFLRNWVNIYIVIGSGFLQTRRQKKRDIEKTWRCTSIGRHSKSSVCWPYQEGTRSFSFPRSFTDFFFSSKKLARTRKKGKETDAMFFVRRKSIINGRNSSLLSPPVLPCTVVVVVACVLATPVTQSIK